MLDQTIVRQSMLGNFTQAWIRKRFLMKKKLQQIRIIRSLFWSVNSIVAFRASHVLIVVILALNILTRKKYIDVEHQETELSPRKKTE